MYLYNIYSIVSILLVFPLALGCIVFLLKTSRRVKIGVALACLIYGLLNAAVVISSARIRSDEIVSVDAEVVYEIGPPHFLNTRSLFERWCGYKRIRLNDKETDYYLVYVENDVYRELGMDEPYQKLHDDNTYRVRFQAKRLAYLPPSFGLEPVREIEIIPADKKPMIYK